MKARELFEMHGSTAMPPRRGVPTPPRRGMRGGAPVVEPEAPPTEKPATVPGRPAAPRPNPFPNPFVPEQPGEDTTPKACFGRRRTESMGGGMGLPRESGINSPLGNDEHNAPEQCQCGELVYPRYSTFGYEYQCPTCGLRWEAQKGTGNALDPKQVGNVLQQREANPVGEGLRQRAMRVVNIMLETKMYARRDPSMGAKPVSPARLASAAVYQKNYGQKCPACAPGRPCPNCRPQQAARSANTPAPPNTGA